MIWLVTGTGTEVGKTVATAALCSVALERAGHSSDVGMIKPVQTGLAPGEPGDAAEVRRLSTVASYELRRFLDPLSPEAAARTSGQPEVSVAELSEAIRAICAAHDDVFVEGAGGLLVRLNAAGETFADLAEALQCPVILVVAAELGTLNHTALTVAVLRQRGLDLAGIIIGSWPRDPSLACRENLIDLPRFGPLLGRLPERAAQLPVDRFRADAPAWLRLPQRQQ